MDEQPKPDALSAMVAYRRISRVVAGQPLPLMSLPADERRKMYGPFAAHLAS